MAASDKRRIPVKRTRPVLLVVNLGFGSSSFLCGLGLGALENWEGGRPMLGFLKAFSLRHVNPEAWIIGPTATRAFSLPQANSVVRAARITVVGNGLTYLT